MDFYNDLITQKSWETLKHLAGKIEFVLIGGWAVYLYTHALKSKDIDIIVQYDVLSKLREDFAVVKNGRLKKYEARNEEVQIDVYVPFYSEIGIPAEEIVKKTKNISGFRVPSLEMLLILKQYVFQKRNLSPKGEKDRLDIICLLQRCQIHGDVYKELLVHFKKEHYEDDLLQLLTNTTKVVELGINPHQMKKLREKVMIVLGNTIKK